MMRYCSRIFNLIATWFPRKPVAYLCLFVAWAVTLWFLSSGNPVPESAPKIPHLDKVAHFVYFFVGGALLATCGLVFRPTFRKSRWLLFSIVVLICSLIGRLDEYHQSFTPGRSGNDYGDWLADTLGGAAGAWFVLMIVLPGILHVVVNPEKKSGKTQFVANSLD